MIRFFASHPTAANILMIMLLALGLFTMGDVKRSTFPDLSFKRISVNVVYPGANPEEVEEAICRRLEDKLDSINALDEIYCEARESIAKATLIMEEGGDLDTFRNDIQTEVDAIDDFPQIVERPILKQENRTDFVTAVVIYGDMAPKTIKAYAEDMKRRMMQETQVSEVNINGFGDRQIRIELDANRLKELGLSINEVANTVARQTVNLPSGIIETTDTDVMVRFDDERREQEDFGDLIVVGGQDGSTVLLRDVATISDRFENDVHPLQFDDQNSTFLTTFKTRQQDILDVVDSVYAFVEKEQKRLPEGVNVLVTRDVSSVVRDRIELLTRNGVQGVILVFLTMWLFFSLRYSFWVAMGLPVSFAGGFFIMYLAGMSFNVISLIGVLIAVGLLMDDAIVISENIASHRARGKSPLMAAIDGTKEVFPGVTSSFITTACVFVPLALMTGDMGEILRVMPIVLIMILGISLIEAFLILPMHLSHSMHAELEKGIEKKPPHRFKVAFEEKLDSFRAKYVVGFAEAAVKWRYLFVGCVIAVLILSISMLAGGVLKFKAFPDLDGEIAVGTILLPQGTPRARTLEVVEEVKAGIRRVAARHAEENPDEKPFLLKVSQYLGTNQLVNESGDHVANVYLDLTKSDERSLQVSDILKLWDEEVGQLADVISLRYVPLNFGPAGLPIDLELKGDNIDDLSAAAVELATWFQSYDGVQEVTTDLRPGKPEYKLHLREEAKSLGIDSSYIAQQLRSSFYGQTASEIQVEAESYEIDVRMSQEDRNSIGDLEYFTITAPNGAQVPLTAIAEVERSRGYARINRVDGYRVVRIEGDIDTEAANAAEIVADTMTRFMPDLLERYPGVYFKVGGQTEEAAKTGASVGRNFMIGLLGIFLLLSFQFRSYVEPVIVMLTIPTTFIGVVWGHLLLGFDLSMPSMVGLASLAGVVVNNSILLVTFVKIRQEEHGLSVAEAAVMASRDRFRPVLITSLTTLMGLLPILSETSMQAQFLKPLIVSIAFGLASATMLVLFLVPAAYTILQDIRGEKVNEKLHLGDSPAE